MLRGNSSQEMLVMNVKKTRQRTDTEHGTITHLAYSFDWQTLFYQLAVGEVHDALDIV
jgi:hypothetical protein